MNGIDYQVSQKSLRISELSCGIPNDDDYMIVEKYIEDAANRGWKTFKIKYGDFKRGISNLLSVNLGSMAYLNKDDIAKFAHGHDYTNFDFFSSYGPNSNNPVESVKLGNFKIRKFNPGENKYTDTIKEVHTIKATNVIINELEGYKKHQVGDVRFFAIKEFGKYLKNYFGYTITDGNIDITKDSFNGWVIPNGKTYYCSQDEFKDACRVFSGSETATQFTVPKIENFMKFNPNGGKTSVVIPYQNSLQKHKHVFQSSSRELPAATTEFPEFELSCVQTAVSSGNYNTLHASLDPTKYTNPICGKLNFILQSITMDSKLDSVKCKKNDNEIGESYPTHINIPCLIYIGDK